MQINIEKRSVFMITAVFVLLAGIVLVNSYVQSIPNPGHGADTVWITNDSGSEKTLQSAINSKDFGNNIPVMVTIRGETKTLQQAIDDGDFLSSGSQCVLLYNSVNDGSNMLSRQISVPASCMNDQSCLLKLYSVRQSDDTVDTMSQVIYSQATDGKWNAFGIVQDAVSQQEGINGDTNSVMIMDRESGELALYDDDTVSGVHVDQDIAKFTLKDRKGDRYLKLYYCPLGDNL